MNRGEHHEEKAIRDPLLPWIPPILWMALLFYLSSLPKLPGPEEILTIQIIRKTGHAGVYAVLGALNHWALRRTTSNGIRHGLWAWVLTVCYAITDELHQGFVPGRNATLKDIVIDALGAALAVYFLSRQTRASDPAA
jgi:VanZ family protein